MGKTWVRLNLFTDYCLRTLMYLGMHEGVARRSDVAKAYAISDNHLMKVVHWLSSAGYVDTMRGRGGGIRLSRPPISISIGELVRRSESGSYMVECFEPGNQSCHIAPVCQLKPVLHEAQEAMLSVLDRYSLADVLGDRQSLRSILIPVLS